MAHEIETFDDGTAAFFTARQTPGTASASPPATASPPNKS